MYFNLFYVSYKLKRFIFQFYQLWNKWILIFDNLNMLNVSMLKNAVSEGIFSIKIFMNNDLF
jgi:hypothetical protein